MAIIIDNSSKKKGVKIWTGGAKDPLLWWHS